MWLRQALQASSHRPGAAPRVLSAAPPPIAPAFCTRSRRRRARAGEPRLQSGRREVSCGRRQVSLRTDSEHNEYTPPQCDIHVHVHVHVTCACSSVRMAACNVRPDFSAGAAHKGKTQVNLLASRASGWLSQHPILSKTPLEDSFLLGFESNMHACTQHAFRHGSNFHRRSSNSLADGYRSAWRWMQRRWAALSRARGGAPGRCRRQ